MSLIFFYHIFLQIMKNKLFNLILLLFLVFNNIQSQIRLRDSVLIKSLQLHCPACIDKNNVLTSYSQEIKILTIERRYEEEDMFVIKRKNDTVVIDSNWTETDINLNWFASLEQLKIVGGITSKIINWPSKLKALDLSLAFIDKKIPPLPDDLVYLQLGYDLYFYEGTNIIFFFDYMRLPDKLEALIIKENYSLNGLKTLPSRLKVLTINNNSDKLAHLLPILPPTLKVLRLENNYLDSLPSKLPDSLQYLYVSNNDLTRLPALPSGLLVLNANHNQIDSFLSPLPPRLRELNISHNDLKAINFEFAPSLERLDISHQLLTSVKINHLTRLRELNINNNQIESINLPPNLAKLSCAKNKLQKLDSLPLGLVELHCNLNQLAKINVVLPKLIVLDCSDNLLTTLVLNQKQPLQELYCQNNRLKRLDALPDSLRILNCAINQLESLPEIGKKLFYLDYSGNKIAKLDNLPPTLTQIINQSKAELKANDKKQAKKKQNISPRTQRRYERYIKKLTIINEAQFKLYEQYESEPENPVLKRKLAKLDKKIVRLDQKYSKTLNIFLLYNDGID